MSTTYTKKVLIEFKRSDELVLDGQSRVCNWLYNQLIEACEKDYKENNNEKKLLSDRNLRDYAVSMKEEYPFLKAVFSSVLKEPAARLKLAYEAFFKGDRGHPHFRSWKNKWFSLVYDEPNKGWEVRNGGSEIAIALGQIPELAKIDGKRNPYVVGKLKEHVVLKPNEIFKTLSIVKQHNKFYGIFVIEKCSSDEFEHKAKMTEYRKECNAIKRSNKENEKNDPLPKKPVFTTEVKEPPENCKWAAIDPNHKNFFVLLDYQGNNIEFTKLEMVKYWDKVIDKLKSKRDKCEKNYKKRKTENGAKYTVHSPRWNRLNEALERAYDARREQIKSALYSIAHVLYKEYDLIMIGDYVPSNATAPFDNMKRSMLNQTHIGSFRKTLEWVAQKEGKFYKKIDERNTTKTCCICGFKEKKDPNIREYTCPKCGTKFMRDSNSAANIGVKGGYSLEETFLKKSIENFSHKGYVKYGQKAQIVKI